MYLVRRARMPVLIEPGSTVVIPTPNGDTSRRAASANPFMAAFVAPYEEREAGEHRAHDDDAAVPAGAHPRQDELDQPHRGEHVDAEHLLDRGGGQVLD